MLFYPANLVINVVLNRVACNYLELNLQLDDISEKYRKLHFTTYFKKFHKFSYLDPTSNHPSYVFKGLIKTECIRYFRNSLTREDYHTTIKLFKLRLLKAGYSNNFIDRHMLSYEVVKNHLSKSKQVYDCDATVLYPMVFDIRKKLTSKVGLMLRRARKGLRMNHKIIIVNMLMPKLRNVISTRRILHEKLAKYNFDIE